MANIIQDVKPKGMSSAYVGASFDKGKAELEEAGYQIISLEQNAKLRMQEGKDAYVSQNGNWVKEGFLYIPNKGKFFTKNSPIMGFPTEATNAHRNGREFYLTDEQIAIALINSLKLPNKDFSVPTNRFGKEEVTAYAFGNFAQDYGDFLREAGIKEMPVWMVDDIGSKPFARQTWFNRLDDWSRLIGSDRSLNFVYRVRGVCEDALASEPNKNSKEGLLYSTTDLEILRKVRTGDVAPRELEKILARFR